MEIRNPIKPEKKAPHHKSTSRRRISNNTVHKTGGSRVEAAPLILTEVPYSTKSESVLENPVSAPFGEKIFDNPVLTVCIMLVGLAYLFSVVFGIYHSLKSYRNKKRVNKLNDMPMTTVFDVTSEQEKTENETSINAA